MIFLGLITAKNSGSSNTNTLHVTAPVTSVAITSLPFGVSWRNITIASENHFQTMPNHPVSSRKSERPPQTAKLPMTTTKNLNRRQNRKVLQEPLHLLCRPFRLLMKVPRGKKLRRNLLRGRLGGLRKLEMKIIKPNRNCIQIWLFLHYIHNCSFYQSYVANLFMLFKKRKRKPLWYNLNQYFTANLSIFLHLT